MKFRNLVAAFGLLVSIDLTAGQGLPESNYWDDIELIDGQVIRGFVVDTVNDRAVIELSTRDFISLPRTSVRVVSKGVARPTKPALNSIAIGAEVDVSLTSQPNAAQTQAWATRWATERPELPSRIELVDGTALEGAWVETDGGYAVIVLGDGAVTGVSRAKIRRVTAVGLPAAQPTVLVSPSPIESAEPGPDLLHPFVEVWTSMNGSPEGVDASGYRALLSPTAATLPAGRFAFSQLDLVGTQATWGVTDNLQIQAGATLPGWLFPHWGTLTQLGVQYALELPQFEGGRWRFSGLNWFLFTQASHKDGDMVILEPPLASIWPAALLTVTLKDWEFTGSMGLWKDLKDSAPRSTTGVSLKGKLSPHWALVGDGQALWYLGNEPENWFSGALAFRYWNEFLTTDVGVHVVAPWGYQQGWTWAQILPVLNFAFVLP